ncbi:GNAT family N-acetyltransferase [Nesterenkonia aerolata]|uniref:GNAT family N-acetyltransferase n=1 Tax=Nesterenkonia aerolata TaxID=3074079 RepID=A0ABU2DNE4_9MICC|nr:GNAT family N-acetyltransferase [Nesterenkonia sp. LY-0111]MDR8018028.1 GNAT family N-acetyltransferase [Nesterenkonia sp. LY-0111]
MITLREVKPSDLDQFFLFQQDADAAHMAGFAPSNPRDRGVFDHHWAQLTQSADVIVRTIDLDGEPVGSVAAYDVDGVREIMFWTDKQYWGRGVTTEAAALFLDEFPRRPVQARVVIDNGGMLKILEDLGFTVIGEERSFSNARAEVVTEQILQLD